MTRFENVGVFIREEVWFRLFSGQTCSRINTQAIFKPNFSPINTPNILKPSHSSYLSAYENGTVCSETSAYKIQMPGNYPEECIQHSGHGESLKS